MNYLTKDWYWLDQHTDDHYALALHPGAGVYDEALFLELFAKAEQDYVENEREVYDEDPRLLLMDMDAGFGAYMDDDGEFVLANEWGITAEEYAQISADEMALMEEAIQAFDERPPFDEKAVRRQFKENYEAMLSTVVVGLPPAIQGKIADPRVYTLGYCTAEVYELVKRWSVENLRASTMLMEQYELAMKSQALPEGLREDFGFHDCLVEDVRWEGGSGGASDGAEAGEAGEADGGEGNAPADLIIDLNTDDGFTDYNRIVFRGAMVRLNEGITGKYWLYDELYRLEDSYEVHVLCVGEDLAELILTCRDIEMEEV